MAGRFSELGGDGSGGEGSARRASLLQELLGECLGGLQFLLSSAGVRLAPSICQVRFPETFTSSDVRALTPKKNLSLGMCGLCKSFFSVL